MAKTTIWTWKQSNGKIFTVIADPENGVIEVRDDKGEVIFRKTQLSHKQIQHVEQQFLSQVAKKTFSQPQPTPTDNTFDPMIA